MSMKLQMTPRIGGTITGSNGITVTRSNGVWALGLQYSGLLVNFVGDSGAGGVRGFVPAPAAGDAVADKFLHANGTWQAVANIVVREKLIADQTYYVRKDGNNVNNGKSDNAGGAWLTIQYAINWVRDNVDASNHAVRIQVRAGTYIEDIILYAIHGALDSQGLGCILIGDETTPSNVIINGTSIAVFALGAMPQWLVSGFKIVSGGYGVWGHANAWIRLGKVEFGASTLDQVIADQSGTVELQDNYTISGGAVSHAAAQTNGRVLCVQGTATLSGTPAFTTGFVNATRGGQIDWMGTFAGAATGGEYFCDGASRIDTAGRAIDGFFPGNSPGILSNGSTINGATSKTATSALTTTTLTLNGSTIDAAWTSFTPTVAALAGAFTTTSSSGRYKLVGKTLHISVTLTVTNVGSATIGATLTLPSGTAAALQALAAVDGQVGSAASIPCAFIASGAALITICPAGAAFTNGHSYAASGTIELA